MFYNLFYQSMINIYQDFYLHKKIETREKKKIKSTIHLTRKSLESEGGHSWREYTYRKITPCDACGQVLRGHSRQGVRCRGCKANAHTDCINLVQPAMCPSVAPKKSGGIPLLRRQKTQAQVDETATSEYSKYEPVSKICNTISIYSDFLIFLSLSLFPSLSICLCTPISLSLSSLNTIDPLKWIELIHRIFQKLKEKFAQYILFAYIFERGK